ncbi:MAG TPA: ferric reductase-like transmembrane domain-containing protein [Gaiellaceae bacterium]
MSTLVAAGGSATAFWYLTRGTGIVALLLLTLVVVLGVSGVTRWRTERLPRFVVAGLHRNLTLLAIAFVVAHVVTTVADGYAPVRLRDAVVPFLSAYRPVWLGLGAVAFDLLLALTVTSLLRARVGLRTWRALHWLAYAAWPVALVHSLGSGSDARVGWMRLFGAVCTLLVGAAVLRRLANGSPWTAARGTAAAAVVLVPLLVLVWYRGGPGKPGWAARAGTPSALLGGKSASLPAPPFTSAVHGRIVQSRPDATGTVTVGIDLVSTVGTTHVWLRGQSVAGGGVRVRDSRIAFGTGAVPNAYVGELASLDGTRLTAVLRNGAGVALDVVLALSIDRASGTVGGTLQATAGGA